MSNALHEYAKLFEKYAANNGGIGVTLAGEDCLSLANEMRIDADAIDAENAKLRELVRDIWQFTGTACKKYPKLFDPPAQGGQMVRPNYIDAFEQRMRELGVSE